MLLRVNWGWDWDWWVSEVKSVTENLGADRESPLMVLDVHNLMKLAELLPFTKSECFLLFICLERADLYALAVSSCHTLYI